MIAVLAAVASLGCAEAAAARDTASVLYIAARIDGGAELARRLGEPLPAAGTLAERIHALDRRLATCTPPSGARRTGR